LRRAQIALFKNATAEARAHAGAAEKAGAQPARFAALRGEAYYRENQFELAAAEFARAGRQEVADKLRALQAGPYRIRGPQRTRLAFVQTDPLPLITLTVNGRGPFYFLIDTGGGELLLDPAIADSVGAPRYGKRMGTFAGDQKASVEFGSVDSVGLGEFTVTKVPISILSTKKFAAVSMGRPVAGVLGTTLLSRFRATLDYPSGALILERRGSTPEPTQGATEIPFWLVGDHYMLAPGSLGKSGPLLWFIDTGLAGAAFTAPASTLAEGGIALKDTVGFSGVGGAGSVHVIPFRVDELRLGDVEQSGLMAFLGPFPASLERSFGPRIAGIVSHAFLRSYRVTFDFDRMRITLARPS
jgi:predicted aspartyl protease